MQDQLLTEKEVYEAFLQLVAAHRSELFLLEAALRCVNLLGILDEAVELARRLVEGGESKTNAAKLAAKESGIKKGDIYRALV